MRLIDADALPRHGQRGGLVHWKDIENAPTIDMAAVGQWEERYIEDDECPWTRRRFYCSHCGKWQTYGRTKFCSNCGAKTEVKK